MNTAVVVIGVGNPYRRDDGVGPAVIERLRSIGLEGAGLDGVTLAESDGEASALIMLWDRRRLAILIDAMRAAPGHPGRVHRLVVPLPSAERAHAASSHAMDMGAAVQLARELDRLPDRMIVFGIEVADTQFGTGLSPSVANAADRVAAEIAAELPAHLGRDPGRAV
jgi:hydrogenase maturation protease